MLSDVYTYPYISHCPGNYWTIIDICRGDAWAVIAITWAVYIAWAITLECPRQLCYCFVNCSAMNWVVMIAWEIIPECPR